MDDFLKKIFWKRHILQQHSTIDRLWTHLDLDFSFSRICVDCVTWRSVTLLVFARSQQYNPDSFSDQYNFRRPRRPVGPSVEFDIAKKHSP